MFEGRKLLIEEKLGGNDFRFLGKVERPAD